MVMQLDAHVQANPGDAPFLERAALDWGDYLFERRDFRAAVEAYALVNKIPIGSADAAHWARFQRARALLHLEDFAASLALLDEIAASDSPWAEQSRLKAAYVRMEQRLRGLSTSS